MAESVLIEQLYTSKECEIIRSLYKEDPSSKNSIREAIGSKLITSSDKIITSKPIDALCLICLTAKFADSEDECYRVAVTVYQYHDKTNETIPSIVSDEGLKLANKTLIALSFHPQALERRWKYHGAPSPSYYRRVSKLMFQRHEQNDIASHHEQWEAFLGEVMV